MAATLYSPRPRRSSPSSRTPPAGAVYGHTLIAYTHPHLLVIDEVGYLSYGPDAANVLFQVVNDRYLHQRPMIFTTNKPLAAWGRVLHDPDLAEAILDRVLERGRHIELRGRSDRTRHAPLDLNPGPRGTIFEMRQSFRKSHARVSGTCIRDRAAAECRLGAEHPPRTCLHIWLAERPRFME